MYHQIGLCTGPCAKKISKPVYDEMVADLITFLEGKDRILEQRLEERMKREAALQNYEAAARIRDHITAIRESLVPQFVVGSAPVDTDVFGTSHGEERVQISVLHFTKGTMTDSHSFVVKNTGEEDFMTNCMLQFYLRSDTIPNVIYTDTPPESSDILEQILSDMKGSRVFIRKSSRGKPRQWVLMAQENAQAYGSSPDAPVLEEIARVFRLPQIPSRMECYDISSFQGSHPVASRAVFVKGEPDKSLYRHYRIRGIEGQDDFAMMEQVLTRRLGDDESKPDLIIIDGGKGQLSVTAKVLKDLGMEDIPILSMAKTRGTKKDRFFLPGRKDAVHLQARSPALFLMQRIRDEAHRFAVKYHKHLRRKTVGTILEDIPGIGPKKARAVLMHFPQINDLKDISPEDLEGCPSLTPKDREAIIKYFGTMS